jgi:retinol dehydrogenase-12
MEEFLKKKTAMSASVFRRMFAAVFMQGHYAPTADSVQQTLQQGKLVLITGGSAGIGFETAKALVERGAHVVIANRTVSKLEQASTSLLSHCKNGGSVDWLAVDLGDVDSVLEFVKQFAKKFSGRKIDTLIENAGVWPRCHSLSPQGFESSFATNLLGHYLLRSRLHSLALLAPQARIVVVTGDIYIKSNDCTKDFMYSGEGEEAYCRSKLGVHWMFNEFHRKFPNYEMIIVHPGVIRTELAVDNSALFGLAAWIKSAAFLSEEQGCQATLICALAPTESIVNGGYYHNTCGLVELSDEDPVNDNRKSSLLIKEVEDICAPLLARE